MFLRAVVVPDEKHYKSDACASDEHESVFGASDACAVGRAYVGGAPCVLPQH